MARIRKKNSLGLNVTGQAASTARAVMKLVSRISGMERPSAPTAHVNPRLGSQLTRSESCRPLKLGS